MMLSRGRDRKEYEESFKNTYSMKLSFFCEGTELLIHKGSENMLCTDSMKITYRHTPVNLEMNQIIDFKRLE